MSENSDVKGVSATIVIVAWRLVDELRECLDSLGASVGAPAHEVIVVLNGASEHTAEVAREHPTVSRIITRRANIGFGAACNLAARGANGEYLIFLNDDTRVDPFWLRSIIESSSKSDDIGAVTSLLLNYDGTVQEAGSRILSHGGTVQLGNGLSLDEAQEAGLIERRMVDYGSAAALLVSRANFDMVGGFDPLFEPAYFEDVDLQLRLQEVGLHIWFEPDAKVLHHAGKSTSTDHWYRHFAANRSGHRFIERWRHMLASAPAPDDPPHELCEVPRRIRPRTAHPEPSLGMDDSVAVALAVSREYEAWLVEELDQRIELRLDVPTNPLAPSRRELLEQIQSLLVRLEDLENRGPLGIAKMRIGVWRNRRRDRDLQKSAKGSLPSENRRYDGLS